MKIKLRIISVISALCCLGSIACYSAAAADILQKPSGEEEIITPAPTDPVVVDPAPVEPVTPDPGYVEPVTPEPVDPEPAVEDPVYVESTPAYEPEQGGTTDPSYTEEPTYSATYSDVISEGNFPQQVESYVDTTTSTYVDYTQQYNQYIYNNNMQQYDDNYIYVPEYEEPTQSLVPTESKVIDTDELTKDDWKSIMLDLSNGTGGRSGAQTFAFIKDNEEEGDTDMMWLVYLGTALIIASILLVIYIVVSTAKATSKQEEYYYI